MYPAYKKKAIKYLFQTFTLPSGCSETHIFYNNDVPYIKTNGLAGKQYRISLEVADAQSSEHCVSEILKIYGMPVDKSAFTYVDRYGVAQYIILGGVKISGCWMGSWSADNIVYSVLGMNMYSINEGKIDKLFVMFLIDPLEFIAKMRRKIGGSRSKNFFESLEYYIDKKNHNQLDKYFVLKNMAVREGIVSDIICVVINKWYQLEGI